MTYRTQSRALIGACLSFGNKPDQLGYLPTKSRTDWVAIGAKVGVRGGQQGVWVGAGTLTRLFPQPVGKELSQVQEHRWTCGSKQAPLQWEDCKKMNHTYLSTTNRRRIKKEKTLLLVPFYVHRKLKATK